VTSLAPAGLDLLSQPNAYFHANGIAVMGVGIAFLSWPLVLWKRAAATP